MSPIFQDASSSKISSAVPTFGGESRKFFEQPFVFTTAFHARLCCTLLGGTGGGWWRVCPDPPRAPFSLPTPEF